MNTIFDKYYKKYDAWYERNKFAYLSELEAIKKVLPKKGYGMEIGVGSGRFAAPLGIQVGIDPSEKMVELARKRGVDARLGAGEDLSFDDSTFDYAAIIITLCFVQSPGDVIKEVKRVLKDGGEVIIGIVDKDSFLGRFYKEKKSVFYNEANFFGVEEVVDLLKASGFRDFLYFQTIFDHPDRIKEVQEPREGYGEGGFVVIRAGKGV